MRKKYVIKLTSFFPSKILTEFDAVAEKNTHNKWQSIKRAMSRNQFFDIELNDQDIIQWLTSVFFPKASNYFDNTAPPQHLLFELINTPRIKAIE